MNKTPNTTIEILHHLYSYISSPPGTNREIQKQYIEKLFSANVRILEVVDAVRSHRDDVLLALIEGLNLPKNKTFSLHENTLYILEQIGDHNTALLIMENFNDYIERYNYSLTRVLDAIAFREGEKTERLIVERYVDYLIQIDKNTKDGRRQKISTNIIPVLSSIKKSNSLGGPRLPSILEKYIEETGTLRETNLEAYNLALFILAKIEINKAIEIINYNTVSTPEVASAALEFSSIAISQNSRNANSAYITITVKNQENSPFEETPYLFEFEKPLVLFLKSGTQDYQFATLVGREESQNNAVRIAQQYIKKNLNRCKPPKNEFQECLSILTKYLNFENFGFQQSYIELGRYPTIIYHSKWCKVRFSFKGSGQQHDHETYVDISYGRLHAPNNGSFLLIDKEEHWSWHNDTHVLNFIDGLLPAEAIKNNHMPRIKDQYRKSDLSASLQSRSPAEWTVGMVAFIWKEYDKKLFDVFNIENQDLWQRYQVFLNEIYAIEKPDHYGLPPYNKIY